ncbi:ROK family protein [Mycetocola sp.]|uniref:ROK family protein n=1 Tax=Mycetocola sp. TaxID=1871042 RepID=UPI0039891DAC
MSDSQSGSSLPRSVVVAGIDIGGTKISAILVDRAGIVLAESTVVTPAREGGEAMSAAAAALVRDLERKTGHVAVAAGVGAAGVIDPLTGVVTAASETFSSWTGFPLADDLSRRLGVATVVANDVNAFLHGEMSYGAVAGSADAIGIMLGTGVGGAIAFGGDIFDGPRGAAGEIGHTPGYGEHVCTCGQIGHLETVASGRSIGARYSEKVAGTAADSSFVVAERARHGDATAIATFEQAGRAVALAIATAVNLLDVRDVVVGGGVRGAWDLLEPALTAALAENEPVSGYPVFVTPSSLKGRAVALGAAALAWRRYDAGDQDPTTPHGDDAIKNVRSLS